MWLVLACADPDDGPGQGPESGGDSAVESDAPDDTDDSGHTRPDPPGADGILTVCEDGTAEFLDFPEAAEEAAEGDTVMICPGTYNASPKYGWNKVFSVVGAGSGLTKLVPQAGAGSMLYFNQTEDRAAEFEVRIEGLTVDASGDDPSLVMFGDAASCDVVIQDVEMANIVDHYDQIGAISVLTNGDVTIDSVYIHDNVGTWKGNGEAPLVRVWAEHATLRHALITDNVVTDNHLVKLDADFSVIDNSTFLRNEVANGVMAGGYGVAYAAAGDDGVSGIWNCTFVDNVAEGVVAFGPQVQGSVFVGNVTELATMTALSTTTESYNLLYQNNHTVLYHTNYESVAPTDLELDPLFTNPAADDYTLQSGSPAIDAGNPDAAYNDMDGTRNDMGAFGGPNGAW